jgi:class 3 adenylate cyclase
MIAPPGSSGRFPADREREVAVAIAASLEQHGAGYLCGSLACGADILFADATRAALAVQGCFAALPGFRPRLAGHVGPTYDGFDPLRGEKTVIGAHVTRAARLERITPPGAIYVTEPFAAALALTPVSGVAATYVGRKPAAKGYGELRLYRLD